MSYELYKLVHVFSALCLFLMLGALLAPANELDRHKKWLMMIHGVATLFLIVSGLGLLLRLDMLRSMPAWIHLKMGLWLVLAFVFPLALMFKLKKALLWALVIICGWFAVYAAIFKPFI